MNKNLDTRTNLLLKNSWGNKDIMAYMLAIGNPVSINKAYEIKDMAQLNGGLLKYKNAHVTVDSVLACLGTTKIKELTYISLMRDTRVDQDNAN